MTSRDLARRLSRLEEAAPATGPSGLSREELVGLIVERLVEHGAEPADARRAIGDRWRLGPRWAEARSWADLAALVPATLAAAAVPPRAA